MVDNPTPSPDSGVSSLPIDPTTGVPVLTIGPSTSNVPSQGQGGQQAPVQTAQQNGPRYDPDVVDEQGLPVDLWANPKAAPVPQAQGNPAPAAPNAAQTTQQQPSSQTQQQQQPNAASQESGPPPDPQDDPAAIERAATRSTLATDKTVGSFMDIARSFNEQVLQNVVAPFLQGSTVSGAQQGAMAAAAEGQPDIASKLEDIGEQYIRDPNKSYVDASELFNALGVQHSFPPTYMGDAGKQVWSTIATSLAMSYGAAKVAQMGAEGTGLVAKRALAIVGRKYSQAMAENPAMWLTNELMSGIGGTVGGEKAEDYARTMGYGTGAQVGANLLGTFSGAMSGGTSAFVSVKTGNGVIRVSRATARGIAEAISEVSHLFGGPELGAIPSIGRQGKEPIVDPDVLNDARAKESTARAAGEAVVQARIARDAQVPWTAQHITANLELAEAKASEQKAVRAADSAWNMIPAEVRGPWSRQQAAIRSKFARTEYPTAYADKQVNGELTTINDSVTDVIKGLSPEDKGLGTAGYSAKVSQGLWRARAIAKGVLSKYWDRAPLSEKMPNRNNVLKGLDGFVKSLRQVHGFNEDQIPLKEINQLRDAFGDIKKPAPKLNFMKNFMTMLHERANQAYMRGDNILGANFDRFHSMLYGVVSSAFPDNVPLQQARNMSKQYFDLFTRSELGKMFRGTRAQGTAVHEEDVLPSLLNRARGLRDLVKAVQWLDNNAKMPKRGAVTPNATTPAQRAELAQLQGDAAQGIKASVSDYINKNEGDPNKAAKMLGDPAFQARIQSYGKVAGEVRQAAQELSTLVQRKQAVESSALAKYMQRDPDKGLDMVWNSSNPSAMATDLMNGTAGVGGFAKDPVAMQGFKAGLLDRFYNTSRGDPAAMQRLMTSARGRVLKTVMGPAEWDRFKSLVDRIESISNEQARREIGTKLRVKIAQFATLKLMANLPEFMHFGEGGQLKAASLASGMAEDLVSALYKSVPPEKMLIEAMENPAYEQLLFKPIPVSPQEARELQRVVRRVSTFERGTFDFFTNWMAYGDGDNATKQDDTDAILPSLLGISPAHAGEVVPLPIYPGSDVSRRLSMERMKSTITADNPNKSPQQINNAFDQQFGKGGKGATIHLGPGAAP